VVVSGAPATGKSTVARLVADAFGLPLLSLDPIKEALGDILGTGDVLGTGDERWSDLTGDAAAEIIFRLSAEFPASVAEGWWRRQRRERALREFAGRVEIFCRCEPELVQRRMRDRHARDRHPIHRDVINPAILDNAAELARSVTPLGLGAALIEVDTTRDGYSDRLLADVRAAIGPARPNS
jgi:predicted kinase